MTFVDFIINFFYITGELGKAPWFNYRREEACDMSESDVEKDRTIIEGLNVETIKYDKDVELLVSCSGCNDEEDEFRL